MNASTTPPKKPGFHPSNTVPTVIFLHIPKAAGTTFSRIIQRQYPARHTYTILPTAGHYSGTFADLKRLPLSRRASLRLLKGHMPFGYHRFLPGPFSYITFLREPVERVLSHYAHARRDPEHNLYPYMSKMSLKEALTRRIYVAEAFDNFQTRLISGAWHDVPFGALDDSVLEEAKENLRCHFAMGLVERFDESLLLLRQQFGWRAVFYTRHNTAARNDRSALDAVDHETLELIRRHNRLDRQLYEFAAERCERRIAGAGPHFQLRLRRFQMINRLVSPFLSSYWKLRKISVRAALGL